MTVTVLKTYFKKLKPIIIKYRDYKEFDVVSFKTELRQTLQESNTEGMKYDKFKSYICPY